MINKGRQTFEELKPGDMFTHEGYQYKKLDNAFSQDLSGFVYHMLPDMVVVAKIESES